MLNKWRKPVPTLLTLSLDYVMDNLHIYLNSCDFQDYLPLKIKEKILKRLTISSFFWKGLDFKKTISLMVHSRIEKIDLTSVYVDDELLQILEVCRGLKKVYLSRIGTHNISRDGLISFLKCLPHLQFLQIRNCDIVDDMVLEKISETSPKLSALDVGGCTKITDNGLLHIGCLNEIKYLTLSKTQITNDGLTLFLKGHNSAILRELKIDNCQNINEKGLLAVTEYCPNLEILIFYNCGTSTGEMLFMDDSKLQNLRQLTWTISW